ncbi:MULTISPECIES: dihydrofolate reductase family protein [Peribacillus]|uniref:dihydrofolate reductase family protein n=1 Tax=Peribacillus TaxID=2675229 RepID=UPI001F4EA700|nr:MULTISPECIES: dihydrofolate reductase family protein [unclassified Peribacillus]MCK1982664.1 dihydrofolate reductase family protein [Peribacillus sp. Aquil_B1]MCK2008173.1 dihydrofolate reductase family protein [Peribacillus sp. Aquil_B8]
MKNQRSIILYIGTSIDGYIANADGTLEWLESTEVEGDSGYKSLLKRIDTVIMGKGTYNVIRGFDMNYRYSEYKNYVFSKSVSGSDEHATFIDEDVKTFIKNIKHKPGKDIWLIGGRKLAREFFKEHLIDEFQLAIAPIILGRGISLYIREDITVKFTLTKVEKLGQLAMLHYIKK